MSSGAVNLRFDVKDVHRALDALRRASTPPSVTDGLVEAMTVYQKGAQSRAPKRSGALADSIEVTVEGPTAVVVGTDSPYAQIQEFGGTIRPNAKRIKFMVGGQMVFARKSRINAQPYFLPTFDSDTPAAAEAFADEFDRTFMD